MGKNQQYILTYGTQVLFETVENGKQGIGVYENGEYIFIEESLSRFLARNEMHFVTNLAVAKRIAKDILGSTHGTPYIFMEMIWIPLEIYNRNVTIYVALHHIERISSVSKSKTLLQLAGSITIILNMSKARLFSRLLVACMIKLIVDLKKQSIYKKRNMNNKPAEITREHGEVYYTRKKFLE